MSPTYLIIKRHALVIAIFVTFISTSFCQSVTKSLNFKDINVKEAKNLIKDQKDIQLLDVRTEGEVTKYGSIEFPNVTHIDWYNKEFKKKAGKLNKNNPVLVYCASGVRSKKAISVMQKLGFYNLYNLKGGFKAWVEK